MDRTLLWLLGLVAALAAFGVGYSGAVAGDSLPQGAGPLYGMAVVFAIIAALCFWPWRSRQTRAAESAPVEQIDSEGADAVATDESLRQLRRAALGGIGLGVLTLILAAIDSALGNEHSSRDLSATAVGLIQTILSAVLYVFTFSRRASMIGLQGSKIFLFVAILISVGIVVAAIAAMLLGY